MQIYVTGMMSNDRHIWYIYVFLLSTTTGFAMDLKIPKKAYVHKIHMRSRPWEILTLQLPVLDCILQTYRSINTQVTRIPFPIVPLCTRVSLRVCEGNRRKKTVV